MCYKQATSQENYCYKKATDNSTHLVKQSHSKGPDSLEGLRGSGGLISGGRRVVGVVDKRFGVAVGNEGGGDVEDGVEV